MRTAKVSVVIATYNMANTIQETIKSIKSQDYPFVEIVVYDDCSTDETWARVIGSHIYVRGKENVGVGNGFNAGIKLATGEYIVLMCADDLFTDVHVISDMVHRFERDASIGHVSRTYYQFITGDTRPCRAWRDNNPIILANNPSGLAFRREALEGKMCSNSMFIETSYLVSEVLKDGWGYEILRYDAIAVRVHNSTSTKKEYWLKRRVSSPVLDWYKIGGKEIAKDCCSLIQIKNNYNLSAVVEEIWNFIKLRPKNLFAPLFHVYSILALLTPRFLLRKLPHWYRKYIGRYTTREVKRNDNYCDSFV